MVEKLVQYCKFPTLQTIYKEMEEYWERIVGMKKENDTKMQWGLGREVNMTENRGGMIWEQRI